MIFQRWLLNNRANIVDADDILCENFQSKLKVNYIFYLIIIVALLQPNTCLSLVVIHEFIKLI